MTHALVVIARLVPNEVKDKPGDDWEILPPLEGGPIHRTPICRRS